MPTNHKNIPVYLKENAKFCCWKYEDVNGRKQKSHTALTQVKKLKPITRIPSVTLILL